MFLFILSFLKGNTHWRQTKHVGIPARDHWCVITGRSTMSTCPAKAGHDDQQRTFVSLTLMLTGHSSWMLACYKARLHHYSYSCLERPELMSHLGEEVFSEGNTRSIFISDQISVNKWFRSLEPGWCCPSQWFMFFLLHFKSQRESPLSNIFKFCT